MKKLILKGVLFYVTAFLTVVFFFSTTVTTCLVLAMIDLPLIFACYLKISYEELAKITGFSYLCKWLGEEDW